MKLTKKEVEKVCKNYNLGRLKEFELIEGGLINHNFDVKTEKGNFIFRVLKKGKGPRQKDNEFKVLHFLSKNNYSYEIPVPILNRKGKEVSKLKDRNMWVYKKLEGEHIHKFKSIHLKQIARALAEYHKIIKKLGKVDDPPGWWINQKWILEKFKRMKKIKPKNKIDRLMLKNIDYVKSIMKKYLVLKSPSHFLICHCDFNRGNILWKENKLKAILDFDNCSYRPRIFDVTNTITQFCNKYHEIDKKKMAVFLNEYKKKIKLTKMELNQIFPIILRHQAMIFEWFYNGMEKNKQKRREYMQWGVKMMKSIEESIK